MKLLVTGGMGFMGSNFVRYIYSKYPNYTIINFDALTYAGNPDNLADIEQGELSKGDARRYVFVHGNIVDLDVMKKTIERFQPDVIVNFAAESHVDRSIVDSSGFIRSNVIGMHTLLELSRLYNIRMVHISTDEIYGDVGEGFSTEESQIAPSNPYAALKAAGDMLARSYVRTHQAPVIVVRGSNNFGPYQYPEKLLPLAITNLLEGEPVPVHGSGLHVRTWIHVQDFVEGVDLLLHQAELGSVYNVAGNERPNIELLLRIAEELGVSRDKAMRHVGDRPGADMRYAPHGGKITRDFGWKPMRHIDETLPEVIDWYKKNVTWWKKVKEKSEFRDHYERQKQAKYY